MTRLGDLAPARRPDGLVLAGGRSRRFGSDKRLATFGGEPLLSRAVRTVAEVCSGALFVATGRRPERIEGVGGAVVIADEPPGAGPLGGICAGLQRARGGLVVLACDLPLVRASTLRQVADVGARAHRPAAIRSLRGWEPLVAYYPVWVLNHVRAAISHGVLAPHRLLDRLGAIAVRSTDPLELSNVNSPDDLRAASRGRR